MRIRNGLVAAAAVLLAGAAAPALAGGFSFGFSYDRGDRYYCGPSYYHGGGYYGGSYAYARSHYSPVIVSDYAPPVVVHRPRYVYRDVAPRVVVHRAPRYVHVAPRVHRDVRVISPHVRYHTPYRDRSVRVHVGSRW